MNLLKTHLSASFCYLPRIRITNRYLVEKILHKNIDSLNSNEKIIQSIEKFTGIVERRYSLEEEAASDLAARAIFPLILHNAELKNEIGALLVATTSGDFPSPATSNWVHSSLQLPVNVQCLDVASSCTSFLSALRASFGFLASNANTVVVASEVKHKGLSKSDIRTLSLFADGAGGVYLKNSPQPNSQFLFAHQEVHSELAKNICIPVGGSRNNFSLENSHRIYLQLLEQKKMFLFTVKMLVNAVLNLYDSFSQTFPGKVLNLIFIHQANKNIVEAVKSKLPENIARKIPSLMCDVGNMVSASLPVLRVRVKFLHAMICFHKELFKKESLVSVFSELCKRNFGFSYCVYDSGIIFKFTHCGEDFFIYDDGCVNLEESWLAQISEEEFYFLLENLDKNYFFDSSQSADFWISAGGGFQTLGVIHV